MTLTRQAEWSEKKIADRVDELIGLGFGYSSKRQAQLAFCTWIAAHSQEHWLWALQAYDWGYGELPLQFMIETEECDFAVAKSIFWWSDFIDIFHSDEIWLKYQHRPAGKILQFIIDRESASGFAKSGLTRLEWAGARKDAEIANGYWKRSYETAPRIPDSLLDLSDLASCRPKDSFRHLNVGDTSAFRDLGAAFWPDIPR